jgi:hypothetical protein
MSGVVPCQPCQLLLRQRPPGAQAQDHRFQVGWGRPFTQPIQVFPQSFRQGTPQSLEFVRGKLRLVGWRCLLGR